MAEAPAGLIQGDPMTPSLVKKNKVDLLGAASEIGRAGATPDRARASSRSGFALRKFFPIR